MTMLSPRPRKPARKRALGSSEAAVVNIRPGVNILGVLPHLNYKPWFAIAEFVDNALQSYLANREEICRLEGESFALQVDVILDSVDREILIRDNAAGIRLSDYTRAFRPAEIPPSATGLSEFGMGMKSAACWFTRQWSVRSSALGESEERVVTFDIDAIVASGDETLPVRSTSAHWYKHFTEVRLSRVARFPKTSTIAKIKDHLRDIYRCFLRSGALRLVVNGERLSYEEPEALNAPLYLEPDSPPRLWWHDFDFLLSNGRRAHGFAAIRGKGNTARAGFALFRRHRLIEGSADEGYRPERIFGRSNSYAYQRVFGEIHLEGFSVSHTKDGILWGDAEDELIDRLKIALTSPDCPLLQQADGYRAKLHVQRSQRFTEAALATTATAVERRAAPFLIDLGRTDPPTVLPSALPVALERSFRTVSLHVDDVDWEVTIELAYDQSSGDWLSISDTGTDDRGAGKRSLCLRLSMAHPFMERFAGRDQEGVEPLLRVAVSIALSEVRARDAGVQKAGAVRRNLNELLREVLSTP